MKIRKLLFALFGVILGAEALACTGPRLIIDSYWLVNGGTVTPGTTAYSLGVEVDLFAPTAPTECVAGLGIQSPFMLGVDVAAVNVTVANPSVGGLGSPVTAFSSLLASAAASTALGMAFPSGGVWFGFAGTVDPFTPPPLGPGDVYKLWFDLLIPDASADDFFSSLTFLNFAAGSSDPLHPVEILGTTAGDTGMIHVPEPGPLGLMLAAAGILWLSRRLRVGH